MTFARLLFTTSLILSPASTLWAQSQCESQHPKQTCAEGSALDEKTGTCVVVTG